MTYEVLNRRQVPLYTVGRAMVSKKLVAEVPVHAGEHAVCVRLSSGFMAWGFGTEPEVAEARAVASAHKLEAVD